MKQSSKISVIVMGGGTAGWYTALFLNKIWKSEIEITVIESPYIPPIIAGESGSMSNVTLNNFLEINEIEYIKECKAFPKIGTKLTDWNGVGSEFVHPLIDNSIWKHFNHPSWFSHLHEFALAKSIELKILPNMMASYHMMVSNTVPYSIQDNGLKMIHSHMYHFDSRKQADYLKRIGQHRGIRLIEDRFKSCVLDTEGSIKSIILDSGNSVDGSWFFDCSGFSQLLLKKQMGATFIDYSSVFPCDSVVAWWNEEQSIKPYTTATSMKCGWSWEIPLQGRTGNGYVYDSREITTEEAIKEAEDRFSVKIDPVAKLKFKPEFTNEFWIKNVIGIGLSTGFIEPLESNGLGIVISQLFQLPRFWSPVSDFSKSEQYNKKIFQQVENVAAFISLHYQCMRNDTSFWKKIRTDSYIHHKTLNYITDLRNGIINVDLSDNPPYALESILIIADGLGHIDIELLKQKIPDGLYREMMFANHIKRLQDFFSINSIPTDVWVNFIKNI